MNINLPFLSLLLAGTIAASSASHAGFGDDDDQKIEHGALSLYVGALRQVYENPTEQKVVTFRDGRRFAASFHGIPDWYGFSSYMPYSKGNDEKVYGSAPSGTPIEKADEFFFSEAMQMGGGERPIYDEQGNIIGYEPHPYNYGGDAEILRVTLKLMQDVPQQNSNNNVQLQGEELLEDNPLKAPLPTPSQSSSQSSDEESDALYQLTMKQIRQAIKDGTISATDALEMGAKELFAKVIGRKTTSSVASAAAEEEVDLTSSTHTSSSSNNAADIQEEEAKPVAHLDKDGNGFNEYGRLLLTGGKLKEAYEKKSLILEDGTHLTTQGYADFDSIWMIEDAHVFYSSTITADGTYVFSYIFGSGGDYWDEETQEWRYDKTSLQTEALNLTFAKQDK